MQMLGLRNQQEMNHQLTQILQRRHDDPYEKVIPHCTVIQCAERFCFPNVVDRL